MVDKAHQQPRVEAKTGPSRLHQFLQVHGIKPTHFAAIAGVSRQHLYRLRFGMMEPTRPVIASITGAARRMLKRRVLASELFDLGESGDAEP